MFYTIPSPCYFFLPSFLKNSNLTSRNPFHSFYRGANFPAIASMIDLIQTLELNPNLRYSRGSSAPRIRKNQAKWPDLDGTSAFRFSQSFTFSFISVFRLILSFNLTFLHGALRSNILASSYLFYSFCLMCAKTCDNCV